MLQFTRWLWLTFYCDCTIQRGPARGETSLIRCSSLCNQPFGYSTVFQYQQCVKKLQEVYSSPSLQGLSVPNNLKPFCGELFQLGKKRLLYLVALLARSVTGLGFWVLNFGLQILLYGYTFPDRVKAPVWGCLLCTEVEQVYVIKHPHLRLKYLQTSTPYFTFQMCRTQVHCEHRPISLLQVSSM